MESEKTAKFATMEQWQDLIDHIKKNTTDIKQEGIDRMNSVTELRNDLDAETEEREAQDTALDGKIDKEVADRQADTASLTQKITDEANAREQKDTELQGKIDAEAQTRQEQDTALDTAIKAEATKREEEDQKLQGSLDSATTDLQGKITDEEQARQAKDTEIEGNLATETSNRQTEDQKLQSQIDAMNAASDVVDVVADKDALDSYNKATLTDKDVVKVLNDSSQEGAITYYRYDKASDSFTLLGKVGPYYTKSETDTQISTAVKAETDARTTSEQAIKDSVTAEASARQSKDEELDAAIKKEVSDREAAITAEQTARDAAITDALSDAQGTIDGSISELSSRVDTVETTLGGKQDTLTAGSNITIQDGTISATDTDTTYTAGNGLTLAGTEFSADTSILATKEDISSVTGSLSGYTDTEGMNAAIQSAVSGLASSEDLTAGLAAKQDKLTDGSITAGMLAEGVIPDLTPYAKTETVNTELAKKQNTLKAGTNITISEDGTISSAGKEYQAGTGLTLDGTTFAVADTIATKEDIPDTSSLATKAEIADMATKTYVTEQLAGFEAVQEYTDAEWVEMGF